MARIRPGKDWETDTQVLLLLLAAILPLVFVQSLLVGWGIHQAVAVVQHIPRPDRLLAFFKLFVAVLIPAAVLNALVVAYVAAKFSRALDHVRRGMEEIGRGNLEHQFHVAPGEFLKPYSTEFQRMQETLRELIYRDRDYAVKAEEVLGRCRRALEKGELKAVEREKLLELLSEAMSYLSVVNHHFTKGRAEHGQG